VRVADVFAHLPTLETERLILRPVTADDVSDVFEYASDPEVARYVTWDAHDSLDESRFFVDLLLGKYAAGEVAPWAMVHRREGRLIGTCGFGWWNTTNRSAEIGYAMARRYWGQGLMTEAVREIVRFGFEVMDLNRIEACHDVDNPASGRVMEHAGMAAEGIRREAVFAKGYFRDVRLYSILRREYLGRRP
jgi:[ribosomal protein S5]-alanine N-acetyltransferase